MTKDTVKLDRVAGSKTTKVKRSANQKNGTERRKSSKEVGANKKKRKSSYNFALGFTLAFNFSFRKGNNLQFM